jgi:tRNA nucleotidyltransferase (CCA-adding enzyme)
MPHQDRPCSFTVEVRAVDAPGAVAGRGALAAWPKQKFDLRRHTVTARVAGVWVTVSTRRQLEQLEAVHGRLDVEVCDSAGVVGQFQSATARRAGTAVTRVRSRLDVFGTAGAAEQDAVTHIAREVAARGGRAFVVGGAVRDAVVAAGAGRPVAGKDLDVEVFGVDAEELRSVLAGRFNVDETGRSFAVFKLAGLDVDVSLPRREQKTGSGHRGFIVEADPTMTVGAAALRRDFTINAMSWDPITGELIDPVGGAADLEQRWLRVVSDAFDEDPLRVLRGAQFVARFNLQADAATVARCARLVDQAGELPVERIWGEWEKLLLKGERPGAGLQFLDACDWVEHWPDLAAIRAVQQDPVHHPEGDVFVHTALCLDAWATFRPADPVDATVTGLALLSHDLGKSATTEQVGGRWRAHGHEQAGVEPARRLIEALTPLRGLVEQVEPLVVHHLAPVQLFARRDEVSDAAIRRLAVKVKRLDRLVTVAHGDQAGRGTPVERFEAGEWLLSRAEALGVDRQVPDAWVRGQHLLDAGLGPGRHFGEALAATFDAQIEGRFADTDAAVNFAVDLARRLAPQR